MNISKREQQIDTIIATAQSLAKEQGWQAVSIRKIAKKMDYSTIIIYDKFGSKEKLLLEIRERGFKQLYEAFKNCIKPAMQPQEEMIAFSNTNWIFAQDHSELYQLMFGLSGLTTLCVSSKYAPLTATLIKGRLSKIFNGDDYSLFTNWWALVHGFVSIRFTEKGVDKVLKQFFDEAIKRFLRIK